MIPFLEISFFALIIYALIYLPGKFLLKLLKYKFELCIETPLALIIGISIFLVSVYILSWLKIDSLFNLLVLPLTILQFKRDISHRLEFNFRKISYPELFLIILGTAAMSFITMNSGINIPRGMIFYGNNARDGLFHMSLVGNLINFFPPTHPELSGIPLHGYHFFYDFILAEFSKFYHFNYIDLIFRYFSFFIAFLYGLSTLAIAKFMKLPRFSILLILFLVYFAGGLEMIWRFFLPSGIIYDPVINPLLVNIINPSLILSVSFIFSFYILIFGKNKSVILPALLLGLLPQIKIYSAILVFAPLLFIAILSFLRKKETYYLKIFLLSSVIGVFVFAPFNLNVGGLILAPLALYTYTIKTFSQGWAIRFDSYTANKEVLRLIILYLIAVFVYFIPTLGIRLISLFSFKKVLRKEFYSYNHIFLISIIAISFLLPTFFLQSIDGFNIAQFLWVSYIILIIPAGFAANEIVNFLFKGKASGKILIFILITCLSIPHLLNIWKSYSTSVYYIEKERVEIADYVKKNVPLNDGIMVLNVDGERDIYGLPEIAALSFHPTYYESTITSYKDSEAKMLNRKKEVEKITGLVKECIGPVGTTLGNEMKKTDNRYILTIQNYPCLDSLSNFKLVKRVGGHSLYRLN